MWEPYHCVAAKLHTLQYRIHGEHAETVLFVQNNITYSLGMCVVGVSRNAWSHSAISEV